MKKILKFIFAILLVTSCKTLTEAELKSEEQARSFPNAGIRCCFDSFEKHGGYNSKLNGDDIIYAHEFWRQNFYKDMGTECRYDYISPNNNFNTEECNRKPRITFEESQRVEKYPLCSRIISLWAVPSFCDCNGNYNGHSDSDTTETTAKDCNGSQIPLGNINPGDLEGENWGDLEKKYGKPTALDKLIKDLTKICFEKENGVPEALSLTSEKGLCETSYLEALAALNDTAKELRKQGKTDAADALEKVGLEAGNALMEAIAAGASFLPYVGASIDIFEAFSGRSITPPHNVLSDFQRGTAILSSIASVIPFGNKGVKILAEAIQGLKSTKKIEKASHIAKEIADSAKNLGWKGSAEAFSDLGSAASSV